MRITVNGSRPRPAMMSMSRWSNVMVSGRIVPLFIESPVLNGLEAVALTVGGDQDSLSHALFCEKLSQRSSRQRGVVHGFVRSLASPLFSKTTSGSYFFRFAATPSYHTVSPAM